MTSIPADTSLAGFEFSPGFVVLLLTVGFAILVHLSIFHGALVASATRMHSEGTLKLLHSWLVGL